MALGVNEHEFWSGKVMKKYYVVNQIGKILANSKPNSIKINIIKFWIRFDLFFIQDAETIKIQTSAEISALFDLRCWLCSRKTYIMETKQKTNARFLIWVSRVLIYSHWRPVVWLHWSCWHLTRSSRRLWTFVGRISIFWWHKLRPFTCNLGEWFFDVQVGGPLVL